MSGFPLPAAVDRGPSRPRGDVPTVLDALGDPDCRRVIRAVAGDALTASECADDCDIPLSTVYRKLELLTEARLVDEGLRIRRDGKHASEYRLNFESVCVGVDEEGSLTLTVVDAVETDPAAGATAD